MKKLVLVSAALLAVAAVTIPATASAGAGAPPRYLTALLLLRHPAGLDRFVRSVSDPTSASYREYASVEELVDRFGASPRDIHATMRWLAARGGRGTVGATGTYVTAKLPSALAARALPRAASRAAASSGVDRSVGVGRNIPLALRGHVSAIDFLGTKAGAFESYAESAPSSLLQSDASSGQTSIAPHSGTAAGCAAGQAAGLPQPLSAFTPNQYLSAYGHAALQRQGFRGQGKDVALVEIDGFRKSDLATFAKCFGLQPPPIKVIPAGIKKPLPPGPETTLDLEVLSAAAPKLDYAFVYEGSSSEAGILVSVAAALGSKGHHPDAISISLGGCEPGLIGQLAFRDALDNVFAVAAGAGISVLVAAGDQGSSACAIKLEETETALPLLSASSPASSPYVTAVGGTNLNLTISNRIQSEVVWNDAPVGFGGGGGAPSLITSPRPWWQRGLRAGYGNGRLVPDISGLADLVPGYAIYCTAPECVSPETGAAGWTSIGGTSAATPLMAGGVLLADGYEQRHGAPPLGFLNPLVYAIGSRIAHSQGNHSGKGPGKVLRDVTEGDNDLGVLTPADAGGGKPLGCCSALPGYDVASGWGSLYLPGFAHAGLRVAR